MVFSTSKFHSLSIRPPTPPKDLEAGEQDVNEVLDFLDDPFGTKPPVASSIATKPPLSTPQTSPSSESALPSSADSRKKRVNFEPQPCAIPTHGLAPQSFTPLRSSPLRPLPLTRVSKPLKSILKPSDAASTPPPADSSAPAHRYKSFAEMLESIMKQLASPNRSSKFDAYHSLHRTMQAYDKVPDIQALQLKMGLLTQFIQRDIQALGIDGSKLDSQLIGQALKLLIALARIPELRSAMDDDFCSFIVDRSIMVAADSTIPKAIVNIHLATLMQQSFRPKTMTATRVERILDVLDDIQDRVTGFSVQAYRIRIYKKLIQQKPDVMTKHTERWFKQTLKALLAGQKDINQGALDTTLIAAKTIGTDRQVTKSVLSILNREKKDGDTYGKVVAKELEKMLGSDNAVMVPQIWSAVTALLLGSLRSPAEPPVFPALADWLRVFEKCFQSGQEEIKRRANVAFGFLVYAVSPKEDTSTTWSKFLLKVPHPQLQGRGQWKKVEREAATSGYLTLLYYSLGPSPSPKQLDRYWTEFVADFWSPLVHSPSSSSSSMHALAACRVVSALLHGARKPWDLQRALDLRPEAMMQREDLPVLDPKWVRKSLSSILKFVETLLDAAPWTAEDCKDEPAKTMWLSLLHSLNVASSQEVTTSTESKDAMAHIVNLVKRVWDRHTAQLALSQQKEDNWANKFCFLLETVVDKLGALQFADKCLTRNERDEFEVASTPSSRSRQHGSRISPLTYFIDLLANQSEGKLSDAVRLRAMKLLVAPCYDSQNTRLNKLELLRDCSTILNSSSDTVVSRDIWAEITTLTKASIEEHTLDSDKHTSRQLGKEYDIAVEIFSSGSSYFFKQPQGQDLLVSFANTVRREAGEGAVVLAVIEKVSGCVLKHVSGEHKSDGLPFVSVLLQNLPKTVVRRTIEQGRQNLWPSSPNPGRTPDFDPYNYFYDVVVSTGSAAYHELDVKGIEKVQAFITALAESIRSCSITLLAVYLRKVQEAIRPWVEDLDRSLRKNEQPVKVLQTKITLLWKEVCAAVERLPRRDGQTLLHLGPLITAGFLSRRRGIVNMSIATWNATFGKQETLRYPTQLEHVLQRLRNAVELSLPSLDFREDNGDDALSFYDSGDEAQDLDDRPQSPRVKESPFRILKSSRKSKSPALSSAASRRISSRQAPKVRLRHDNSQLQFEPIVSSPNDPFVQESQILTERQREMLERQMGASNLFANFGSTSSPGRPQATTSVRSPLELHSDALSGDDLPTEKSRTPLKTLASLGPMDVFLGSSPTPQARNRTQEVASDQTSVATPTAIRTLQLDDNEELGSSPPRYGKAVETKAASLRSNNTIEDKVDDSFEYGQPDQPFSASFDDGITIDEDALSDANLTGLGEREIEDSNAPVEVSDMPSSTIELQLDAQFDAEIQAQNSTDNCNQFQKAPQKAPTRLDGLEICDDSEVEETLLALRTQTNSPVPDTETNSSSRVEDSFSSQVLDASSSQNRSIRRSTRHSAANSPAQPASSKKRRSSTGRGPGRPKRAKTDTPMKEVVQAVQAVQAGPDSAPDDDDMLDTIVVASPKAKLVPKKTRRSLLAESEIVVPETGRRRGVRRSASMLSQVETQSEDVVIEDTPAPKRARGSTSQDVSEAIVTPAKDPQIAQTKRLSHVRVTPRRSGELSSSARGTYVAVVENAAAVQQAASDVGHDAPSVGEQNANVVLQLPNNTSTTPTTTPPRDTAQSQQVPTGLSTPSRSFTERVILTPRSIMNQLRHLKEALIRSSQLVLGIQEVEEINREIFHVQREVFDAGRRGDEA